ncbi:MAG: GDP-L-fucose synthase [Pirellulales bacterium]|nr:GDP-L-fucose synthase [Pirellulales bacterium]
MSHATRIFVAGSSTLIGAALVRRLQDRDDYTLVPEPGAAEPSLFDPAALDAFFAQARPEYVVHAAGPSGGIAANVRRGAELAHDNLLITAHLFDAARRHGVERLLYLASSCCYPRECHQPMRVEDLWSGPLEPTNEPYAAAKLAGLALAQAYRRQYGVDFRVGIPANAFGPGDDFDPAEAHVIPSLMARLETARQNSDPAVTVWGTGQPRREFVFADDLADACLFVLEHLDCPEVINLGGGGDVSIGELARLLAETVGYHGRLEFDASKPDGMPRKALDCGPLLALGFRPATDLSAGLRATYRWYRSQLEAVETSHVA